MLNIEKLEAWFNHETENGLIELIPQFPMDKKLLGRYLRQSKDFTASELASGLLDIFQRSIKYYKTYAN